MLGMSNLESDLVTRFQARSDYHQSFSYGRVMERTGWTVLSIGEMSIFVKQIGPVCFAKLQRPCVLSVDMLRLLKRRLSILRLYIEPGLQVEYNDAGRKVLLSFDPKDQSGYRKQLSKFGLHETNVHHAHSKTAILSLEGDFCSRFPSKTRYNVRLSQRAGVTYTNTPFSKLTSSDTQQLLLLQHLWSKRKNVLGYPDDFLIHILNFFSSKGQLVRAYVEEELVGSIFVLFNDRVGIYFNACVRGDMKEKQIPTGLAYTAMETAKESGCDIFDFCSVYDERYPKDNPKWKGFTTFKQRFNPTPIDYPPSFLL